MEGGARLSKIPRLYLAWHTDAERRFQVLAVCIRNVEERYSPRETKNNYLKRERSHEDSTSSNILYHIDACKYTIQLLLYCV